MKRCLSILTAGMILAASCMHEPEPRADFIVSSHEVEVFESVLFTNTFSFDADYFHWDFGDGTWSDGINVEHYYDNAGEYTVTLSAFNGTHVISTATTVIEVHTTALTVIVEEFYDHYRIPDASIILYPTKEDWDFETNMVVEGTTDADGIATFVNLNPVIYFLDVWHPNHNNYDLAAEDVNWIMTDPLIRNIENEFVAYVDYVGTQNRIDGKKIARYKLLKIEPRIRKK